DLIGEVMGKDVQLISSAEETARELKILLQRKKLLSPEDEGRPLFHRFFTSGDPNFFRRIAERWLGCSVHVSRAMAEASVHSPLCIGLTGTFIDYSVPTPLPALSNWVLRF